MDLNISIGILAYNESDSIATTLQSLFQQSLFKKPTFPMVIEIVIVPNGCTDNTAEVSCIKLEKLTKQFVHPVIRWRVCEVEEPGKSNAWNLYVHDFSEPAANYLILMDADIQFLEPDTLSNMIETLENKAEVWVATDTPVKDIAIKEKKGLMERLSVQASSPSKHSICGQLYCGRASVLRSIWMPPGLPVEDGFLRAMVITSCFTSPEVFERVDRVPNASHSFQAYTDILSLIRHENRLVVGSTINSFLYSYLWANCNKHQDAGLLIKHNNEKNSLWLRQLIEQAKEEKGWWLIPKGFYFRRFRNLQNYSLMKAIFKFPFAVIAFFVDLLVFLIANREIHKTSGLGYWG